MQDNASIDTSIITYIKANTTVNIPNTYINIKTPTNTNNHIHIDMNTNTITNRNAYTNVRKNTYHYLEIQIYIDAFMY